MKKIIEDDVDLANLYFEKLPDLSDVEVSGSYFCHGNPLTTLEGIPKSVGGDFTISMALRQKFPEEAIRAACKIEGKVIYRWLN